MRLRTLLLPILALTATAASAQFVWPKPEYTKSEPGLYTEDPFIVEYRREFFAVFRGDYDRFERAFRRIEAMVEKDPKDARARVWLGNGQTVMAVWAWFQNRRSETQPLLEKSWKNLDEAVRLSPEDPKIYMMRAATLYVQGQYLPSEMVPRHVWERLRDDCLRFIAYIGPERMPRTSIHLRGEAYGELGIAYARLGETEKAIEAFRTVVRMNPGTAYEARALREIERLTQARSGQQ